MGASGTEVKTNWRAALVWAAAVTLMAAGWQWVTVRYNYGGDWSALFYTGAATPLPPGVAEEQIHRVHDGVGYDGQYYHLIAHDPAMRGPEKQFVDNPRLRWRRILLPALAFWAAGGDGERVDSAYSVVVLAFVFLGAYWLAEWAIGAGLHPAFALLFLAFPAVAVSLDRYTIDVALAALAIGFALAERDGWAPWKVAALLVVAPFARETGGVVIAAFALDAVLRRKWRTVAVAAAAAVPYAAWVWYVAARTAPDQTVFASWIPFAGLWQRTIHPIQDSTATSWLMTAAVLEYAAVWGVWVAVGLTAWLISKGKRDTVTLAAAVFAAVFVAFLGQEQAWSGVYSFGRTMSPLVIWVALAGLALRRWICLSPMALMLPRILWQLAPQWRGIVHGVLR